MSHHFVAINHLSAGGEMLNPARVSTWQKRLKLGAIGGLILSVFLLCLPKGAAISTISEFNGAELSYSLSDVYAYSWLLAFFCAFTLCCGGLFWCLLHNASNSSWGVAIRRVPETLASLLPVVAVLGLPLVLVPSIREALWSWIHAHAVARAAEHGAVSVRDLFERGSPHADEMLNHKYPYLNLWMHGVMPGWVVRYFLYFFILGGAALVLKHWSVSQDATGDVRPTLSARRFSCGWLAMFAIGITFAGVDWVEGLNYAWFSTMFGVNIFASSAWGSMAVMIIVVTTLQRNGHLKQVVTGEHLHLMGKLLLAFTIFWGYIAFCQYFLIWYANIAEETQFYGIRNTEGWCFFSVVFIVIGHFFVPFVLLLSQWRKKNLSYIRNVSIYVLCIHVIEMYWLIIPERGPKLADRPSIGWAILFDLIAVGTVGATMTWCFLRALSRHSLYPCGDPRLQESINVVN